MDALKAAMSAPAPMLRAAIASSIDFQPPCDIDDVTGAAGREICRRLFSLKGGF
jgi:hypothetical protein